MSNRPAEFDAKLMRYQPVIRKKAKKLVGDDHEDFVNTINLWAIENWQNFRPDGGFYAWLDYKIRDSARLWRKRVKRRRNATVGDAVLAVKGVDSGPESVIDLKRVSALMTGRDGQCLARHAMGDTFREIGAAEGVCLERARQLVIRERERIVSALTPANDNQQQRVAA